MKRLRLANTTTSQSVMSPLMSLLRGAQNTSVTSPSTDMRTTGNSTDYSLMNEDAERTSRNTRINAGSDASKPSSSGIDIETVSPKSGRPPRGIPPPPVPSISHENLEALSSSPRVGAGMLKPAGAWRDRYVMKFNGWSSSQPDNKLPPALTAAPAFPRSTSAHSNGDTASSESDATRHQSESGVSMDVANAALEERSPKQGMGYELDVIYSNRTEENEDDENKESKQR